jgi:hypothetical protein
MSPRFLSLYAGCLLFGGTGLLPAATPAVPHPHDPVLRSEHEAMLELIRVADATHTAAKSGPWSMPATWKEGRVPAAGAVVAIPEAVVVTVSNISGDAIRGVRVEGTLRWDTEASSSLTVDTLLVAPGGRLEMGTPQHPVAATATARLIFSGTGGLDTVRDPFMMGRGLISHGTVSICGQEVTAFAALATAPRAGDKVLHLAAAPVRWQKGDRLVLPAVHAGEADEELVILDVQGRDVAVAPLARDHVPPVAGIPVHVANLTRNVIIESKNTAEVVQRGHIMFMHSDEIDVRYAALLGLGRTDKARNIDEPQIDDHSHFVAGTGANARGRYALHFHRTGTTVGKKPVQVKGCSLVDSPGWGYVNHSSRVDFLDNVAYNVFGSAFVTEAGDEVGSFRHNLAIRSKGSGEGEDERRKIQDFGHEGDGFWFQGGGVTVEDNIATGQRSSGFIFFTSGLIQKGLGTARFAVANLWRPELVQQINHVDHKDPDHVNDPDSVPVIAVPVLSFKRNTAYACGVGFTSRFMQPQVIRSVYEDGLVWNSDMGVHVRYTSNLDLRRLWLIADPKAKGNFAAVRGTLEGEQDIRYENLRVEGWDTGIAIPEAGHHVVAGGFYNNARSIVVPTPMQRGRRVEIVGDIKFGDFDPKRLGNRPQYDIDLEARFAPLLDTGGGYRDPNVIFASDITMLALNSGPVRQLYYSQQATDRVVFSRQQAPGEAKKMGRAEGGVPDLLIDKTNREIWNKYGLAVGGTLAPADAVAVPRVNGLLGTPSKYAEDLRLSTVRTKQIAGYQPVCIGAEKKTVAIAPVDLHQGWNLITQIVDQRPRSFLLYAGETGDKSNAGKKGKY